MTNNVLVRRVLYMLMVLSIALTNLAIAEDETPNTPNVIVKTWVVEEQPVAVRQKVTVMVQIMTDTWFTKGTKIHDIEVRDALVLGHSPFAQNSIERVEGTTYTTQTWEIVLYPLVAGTYVIPGITIEYEVKGARTNSANLFVTDELTFDANQPSAQMHDSQLWLVTPQMELKQTWEVIRGTEESDSEKSNVETNTESLVIGDVIQRTISIEATDTSVMLLPEFDVNESESYNVYQQVLQSKDRNNRGIHTAVRVQSFTYLLKDAGPVVIPAIEMQVWNPETQKMTSENLQGREWQVKHTFKTWFYHYWVAVLGTLLVIGAVSVLIWAGYRKFKALQAQEALPLSWYYLLALKDKDAVRCEDLLYRYCLNHREGLALQLPQRTQAWERRIIQLQQLRYDREGTNAWISFRFYLWLWVFKNKKKVVTEPTL